MVAGRSMQFLPSMTVSPSLTEKLAAGKVALENALALIR